MRITDSGLFQQFTGDIVAEGISRSEKRYRDARAFYKSTDESLDDDTVMYEVQTLNASENGEGRLNWAISLLHPVTVNGECNMTRGHWHDDLNCEEYYWCAQGEGLLMLMDEDGECWCEKVFPGSLHHIDGHLAHRLINTGNTDLRVICVWNSNAGHDYNRVEQHPFPYRVFRKDGKIVVEDR